MVWVHNDSGDEPRLYAVDDTGKTISTLRLGNARAVDWEDMAVAGEFLFAADIGDNRERRDSVQIYRVAEPDGGADTTARAERMDLRYPDGAHDAEALLVHPRTGEIGVITKSDDDASLYVAAAFTPGSAALRRAADVPVALATGAAVAPDGNSVVVRDYTGAFLFDLDGDDLASAFDEPPRRIEMPFAVQAEAITFSADGQALLTTHEGAGATVHRVDLAAEEAPVTTTATEAADAERVSADPSPGGVLAAVAAAALLAWAVTTSSRRRRASGRREDGRRGEP